MNKFSLLLAASLVITSTVHADNRDLGRDSLKIGIADVDWTISDTVSFVNLPPNTSSRMPRY